MSRSFWLRAPSLQLSGGCGQGRAPQLFRPSLELGWVSGLVLWWSLWLDSVSLLPPNPGAPTPTQDRWPFPHFLLLQPICYPNCWLRSKEEKGKDQRVSQGKEILEINEFS